MTSNYNAPHFTLAAVKRIYADLPELVGVDWTTIQPQVDQYIAQLEAQPNAYLPATQLAGLLAKYEPARQRLTDEMTIQRVISQNTADRMRNIAGNLGFDPDTIDGLTAAAYARLDWEADPETVPEPEDTRVRHITIAEGGIDGGQSVKFRNMRLDLGDFTKIAAGFVTTGFDVIDKPHPLLIAAGVLLTAAALHDTMTIELSEQEASVFWGMIQAGARDLTEATILTTTNTEREKYGLDALNDAQVRHSLTKLEQIKSIQQVDDHYRIIERYTIKD